MEPVVSRPGRESLQAEYSRTVFVDELDNSSATASDAGQRIIGDNDWQSGFLHQEFVDVAQHGATTGEDDAAFGDVRTQLGRRLLKRFFNSTNDALQRFLQSFENLVAVECKAARHSL